MSDEPKENRVNIEDLPQAARAVSPEEAQEVQGGAHTGGDNFLMGDGSVKFATGDVNKDIIIGTGAGAPGGHVK